MSASKPSILQTFAPGWFAAVMGTGIISIASTAFQAVLPFAAAFQIFFLAAAVLFFVVALIPWTLRWIRYFADARRDLEHPVSAAFFPTMPISLIVIGIALEKTGNRLLPESALWSVLQALWLTGAIGILFFALVILNTFLHKPEIEWQASTLGWLIPPVSALIVPVLGASLSLHFHGTAWGELNLLGSLVFLGMGSFLFVFVMAVVLTRYIFYALPPAHLAPTMWVGIAPASILAILALRMVKPVVQFFQAGSDAEQILAFLARPIGVMLWGFAAFWLILALMVTLEVWRKSNIPFALSWWAFIFPLGAFAVASGVLYQSIPSGLFLWVGLIALVGGMVLWGVVTFRTVQGIVSGTIFKPHGAQK